MTPRWAKRLPIPGLEETSETNWTNWAGNQTCEPHQIERPYNEAFLQRIVRAAVADGKQVRVAGSGHSFTAAACTNDVLVSLEHMNLVRSIDHAAMTITVDAGIELAKLNGQLAKAGLAMTNLGDIAYQSLAGAISTGTHGTGVAFGGMATQVRGLRIVTATGDIVECNATENPELFSVARVGLGVFGIITRVTLAVEPAFNLHAVEGPSAFDEVLDNWSTLIAEHDHFEFYWIPGSDSVMTKSNRRTNEAVRPLTKPLYMRDKLLGENVAFGAMCKLAQVRPSLVPRLRNVISSAVTANDYIDASHKVFVSPRWVRFIEMEYSIPIDDLPAVARKLDEAVREAGLDLLFPVEVRCAAADDVPLSTAYRRPSAYVAVHRAKGQPYREYFELVEAIMNDHEGRPHWGKMHFQDASSLAPRYPEWDNFHRVRASYDPGRVFMNDYTDRVLGLARL